MKKNVLIIAVILLVILTICIVGIRINSKIKKQSKKENQQFEQYSTSEIYGTDVVTLINKAISSNQVNAVHKNEKGFYISNNKNSILIDLVMITDEEEQQTTVYKMEAISKVGITEFIKNFNTAKFKCTKIDYHKETGKISYIEITQL